MSAPAESSWCAVCWNVEQKVKEVGEIYMGTHSWGQTAINAFDFLRKTFIFLLLSLHLPLLHVHSLLWCEASLAGDPGYFLPPSAEILLGAHVHKFLHVQSLPFTEGLSLASLSGLQICEEFYAAIKGILLSIFFLALKCKQKSP